MTTQELETDSLNITIYDTRRAPPSFRRDTLPPGWVDLRWLYPNIQVEMPYATPNNFVDTTLYPCSRCLLRLPVARAVGKADSLLGTYGFHLQMLDCYRPHPVQYELWNKVPDARYVTAPERGSMHNRGAAVDVTLTNRSGHVLDMGTPYDYFGIEAYPEYTALSDSILLRRQLLHRVMEASGFRAIRTEWWHFSFLEDSFGLADFMWSCPP